MGLNRIVHCIPVCLMDLGNTENYSLNYKNYNIQVISQQFVIDLKLCMLCVKEREHAQEIWCEDDCCKYKYLSGNNAFHFSL